MRQSHAKPQRREDSGLFRAAGAISLDTLTEARRHRERHATRKQKRIVANVEERMPRVHQLEQQLAHSRNLGQQLLEAAVASLTAT